MASKLLLVCLLSSSLFSLVQCAGLTFTRLTSDAGYPPRQNAHFARLLRPQTYFDPSSNANVTSPPNSFLLWGGEFDCTPDVWLSPASNHTIWTLISGWTSFNDCEGPYIPSPYPFASYQATQGRMHAASLSTGRTFLMGGWSVSAAEEMYNTVWYSDDADNHITWRAAPNTTSFTPRAQGGAVTIDHPQTGGSTLYVIAGETPHGYLNDVYYSTDGGVTFAQSTKGAAFAPRVDLLATGYYDTTQSTPRLFVIGGMVQNTSSPFNETVGRDVWTSTNSREWTYLGEAPFAPRARSAAIATPSGVLLVAAGGTTVDHKTWDSWVMLDELWVSFDGAASWVNCTAEGGWSGRELVSAVVDEKGFLWIGNGLASWPSYGLSDLWRSDVSVWDTKALQAACGMKEERDGESKEVQRQEEGARQETRRTRKRAE